MIKAIKSDELEHNKSAGKNNHYNYARDFYMKDSVHYGVLTVRAIMYYIQYVGECINTDREIS